MLTNHFLGFLELLLLFSEFLLCLLKVLFAFSQFKLELCILTFQLVQLFLVLITGLLDILQGLLKILPLFQKNFVLVACAAVVSEGSGEQFVHRLAHQALALYWVARKWGESELQVHTLAKRVGS